MISVSTFSYGGNIPLPTGGSKELSYTRYTVVYILHGKNC